MLPDPLFFEWEPKSIFLISSSKLNLIVNTLDIRKETFKCDVLMCF